MWQEFLDVTASLAIVSASSDVVQEGETLFAVAMKSEADDALSYAWVSHGATVGTGASYTVQESDEGGQITLTVTDTAENGGGISMASATSGTVVDAPLAVAVPLGVVSVNENTPITIQGVTVTGDSDDTPSVTLSVLHGTLSLGSSNGLTITADGSGGTLAFSGSQSDVTAALASGVTYTPTNEFEEASDTLTVSASAPELNRTSTQTLVLRVFGVADAPTVTVPGNDFTGENQAITILGIQATPSPGDEDDALSLDLSVQHGALALASTNGLAISSDGSNGTLSFSGSQSAISAALASGVVYTPADEYEGDDPLTVTSTATEAGNGNPASTTKVMPLTVNPIADTPTVTLPALQTTTTEGASLLWQGITVTAAPGDGDDRCRSLSTWRRAR